MGPGWKPRRQVCSQRGSYVPSSISFDSKEDAQELFPAAASMNLTDSDFVWLVTEQALTAHNVPLGRYHSDLKFSNPWPKAIKLFSCLTQLSMKF